MIAYSKPVETLITGAPSRRVDRYCPDCGTSGFELRCQRCEGKTLHIAEHGKENYQVVNRRGLVVDLFAGGGGASTGMARALRRSPDIGINHDAGAIQMHAFNHPGTRHFLESVWDVSPLGATCGLPVEILWASPDCTHFSVAKGGTPVKKEIRGLANVVIEWARDTRPRIMALENVKEFRTWGPLRQKKDKAGHPMFDTDGARLMEPDPAHAGEYFEQWHETIRSLGYDFSWKIITAADMGTPTIRKRLFMVFRCDGEKILWPKPTHGVGTGRPWRSAAECIDFTIPGKSIFGRKKALARATLRRTARGILRHVIPDPFLVNLTHGARIESLDDPMRTVTGANRGEKALIAPTLIGIDHQSSTGATHPVSDSLTTITHKNRHALVSGDLMGASCIGKAFTTEYDTQDARGPLPTVTGTDHNQLVTGVFLSQHNEGDRNRDLRDAAPVITGGGKSKRPGGNAHGLGIVAVSMLHQHGESVGNSVEKPLGTTTEINKHQLAGAHLIRSGNGEREGQAPRIEDIRQPLSTAPAQGVKQALSLVKLRGTAKDGDSLEKPLDAISAQGQHLILSAVELIKYYGQGVARPVTEPAAALTSKDRLGLVTCHLDGDLEGAIRVGNFILDHAGVSEEEMPVEWIQVEGLPGLQPVVFVRKGEDVYLMTDITLRMLKPRELARAQGFDDSYVLTGTQSNQVARIGNSVCPQCAEAVMGSQVGTWETLPFEETNYFYALAA